MAEFIPPEVKKSEKNWTPPEVKDGKPYIPEPGLEPVGLLESFITPVKAYGLSLPAIKAVEKFGKLFTIKAILEGKESNPLKIKLRANKI